MQLICESLLKSLSLSSKTEVKPQKRGFTFDFEAPVAPYRDVWHIKASSVEEAVSIMGNHDTNQQFMIKDLHTTPAMWYIVGRFCTGGIIEESYSDFLKRAEDDEDVTSYEDGVYRLF